MKFFVSQGRFMLTVILILYMFMSCGQIESKLIQKFYLGRNKTIETNKTLDEDKLIDDPEINIINYNLPRSGDTPEHSNLKKNLIENLIDTLEEDQILSNQVDEFYDV